MTMHYSQASTTTNSQSQHSLVKLVCWQRWYNLEEILQRADAGDDHAMPVFDDRIEKKLPEDHILHLACQHQAPPRVIELLAKKFPKSVSSAENKGRYPLHIACAKGLKPAVINFLVRLHPESCAVQDSYGKSPLHYVCESYGYNFCTIPSNAYRSPESSVQAVVEMLLKEAPESANVEDLYGMNAIEYAIDSDTEISVIKSMQNASRESWRDMQRVHPNLRHEELRQSITSSLGSSFNSMSISSSEIERLTTTTRTSQETKTEGYDSDNSANRGIDAPEKKVQAARTA